MTDTIEHVVVKHLQGPVLYLAAKKILVDDLLEPPHPAGVFGWIVTPNRAWIELVVAAIAFHPNHRTCAGSNTTGGRGLPCWLAWQVSLQVHFTARHTNTNAATVPGNQRSLTV